MNNLFFAIYYDYSYLYNNIIENIGFKVDISLQLIFNKKKLFRILDYLTM